MIPTATRKQPMEGQTPEEVVLVFRHSMAGPHELPGIGVFSNGDRVSFPNQAAADAARAAGYFVLPEGDSPRQLAAEGSTPATPAEGEVTK